MVAGGWRPSLLEEDSDGDVGVVRSFGPGGLRDMAPKHLAQRGRRGGRGGRSKSSASARLPGPPATKTEALDAKFSKRKKDELERQRRLEARAKDVREARKRDTLWLTELAASKLAEGGGHSPPVHSPRSGSPRSGASTPRSGASTPRSSSSRRSSDVGVAVSVALLRGLRAEPLRPFTPVMPAMKRPGRDLPDHWPTSPASRDKAQFGRTRRLRTTQTIAVGLAEEAKIGNMRQARVERNRDQDLETYRLAFDLIDTDRSGKFTLVHKQSAVALRFMGTF